MKDAMMILLEPHEWRLIIESLMRIREDTEQQTWSEHEIDKLMRDIMLHAGLNDAKRIVPEAYDLIFSEGPPKIRGYRGRVAL